MKENEAFCAQNPTSPKCGGTAAGPPGTGPSEEQVQENEAFCAANPDSPKCGGTAEAPPPATEKICAANPKYPGCAALAQPSLGRPDEDSQLGSICEQNPLLPQCQASQETAQPDVPGGRPDEGEPEEAAERPGRDEDAIGGPALPPPIALEEGEAPLPPRTGDLPGSGPGLESPAAPPSIAGGEESCHEGQVYDASTEACVCPSPSTFMIDGDCVPATEVSSGELIEWCLEWASAEAAASGSSADPQQFCEGFVAGRCEQIEAGTDPAFSGAPEDYAFCRDDEPAPEEPVVAEQSCPEGQFYSDTYQQCMCTTANELAVGDACVPVTEVGQDEFIDFCLQAPRPNSDVPAEEFCSASLIADMCGQIDAGTHPMFGGPAEDYAFCNEIACGENQALVDFACQCSAGFVRGADAQCVAQCPTGTFVLDGACVEDCPGQQAALNGQCYANLCPRGYSKVGEECVADCVGGVRDESGSCVNPCADGEVYFRDECRPACAPGEGYNFGGVAYCSECVVNYRAVNGVCVPTQEVPYEDALASCIAGNRYGLDDPDEASCAAAIADSCTSSWGAGLGAAGIPRVCAEILVPDQGIFEPPVAQEPTPVEDEPPIAEGPPDEDEPPVAEVSPDEDETPAEEEPVTGAPPEDGEQPESDEQEVAEGDCPEGQLAVDGACRPLTEVGYDEAIESCLEGGSPGWPAMDEASCAALVAEVCSDIGAGSAPGLPGSPGDYPFCAGPPGDGEEPPVAGEPPVEEQPPVAEAPPEEDEPPYLGFPPIVIVPPGPPDAGEPPEATRPPRRPPVAGPPAGTARPPWPPFLGQPPAAGPPPRGGLPPLPRPAPDRPGAEPPVEAAALTDSAGQEAPPTASAEPLAIAIANAVYQSADVPGRPDALASAVEFVRFLKQDVGLAPERIVPLANGELADFEALFGTREAADGGLRRTLAAAGPSELIIYFAGHGIAVDSGRDAVLLPADADPDQAEQTGYRLSTLYANLAAIGVERLRLFIDASFADALDAQPALEAGPPGSVVAYPIIGPLGTLTPTEWVVVTAGTGTEPTYEDPGAPRSAFTDALIAGLSGEADGDGDGAVTAGELAAFIRARVGSVVKEATGGSQTPALFGSQGEVLSPVGIAKTD